MGRVTISKNLKRERTFINSNGQEISREQALGIPTQRFNMGGNTGEKKDFKRVEKKEE